LSKSFYKNSGFYKKYLGSVFIKRQQKQDNFVSLIFLIIKISFSLLAIISLIKLGYSSKVRLIRLREIEDSFLYEKYRFNVLSDKFDDLPICWESYCPKNFSEDYRGSISLIESFKSSSNIVPISITKKIGLKNIINLANAFGLGYKQEFKEFPSLAIGSYGDNLLNITNAYSAINNNGKIQSPSILEKIESFNKQPIWKNKSISKKILDLKVNKQINKLLNNLLLFKETQRKIFYKIFDEDYMILKTQTYNHNMGFINKDEIKLLGEDRIINYFWKWYKKSEDKDEPWKNNIKSQNLDVYDKVILKYPPEIKKLEIANNIDIIRKTFVRFAAPLIFFMLII